jgi:hypothetical protein
MKVTLTGGGGRVIIGKFHRTVFRLQAASIGTEV